MIKKLILPALILSICIGYAQGQKAKSYELTSPEGKNKIHFQLVDNAPKYAVTHGKTEVITLSDMGFMLKNNEDLSTNFEVTKVEKSTFDETWEQVWGEKKKIRNHYNQLSVKLQQKSKQKRKLEIQFRAYDDGVAFRYTSNKMTSIFYFNRKITQSMSRKGNCWDNAVAESFFKTIKYEWINRFKYTSYNQLYKSIDQYLNWYNNERLHSSLGYCTPLEIELQLKGIINKAA